MTDKFIYHTSLVVYYKIICGFLNYQNTGLFIQSKQYLDVYQ